MSVAFLRGGRRWRRIAPNHSWVVEHPTDEGGLLRLEPARLEATWRLGVARDFEEELTVLCCQVRLADRDGRLWQCDSLFSADVLMRHWLDFEDVFPWEMLSGVRTLCDGVRGTLEGGWRRLLFGESAVSLHLDRQRPRFCLLACGNLELLWVRVRGLVGFRRRVEIDHEGQCVVWGEGNPGEVVEGPLPGVVFGVEASRLLFRNTTFAVDDGFWHRNDVPIPVRFDRLELRTEAQKTVTFAPW
jgi:hypothetical protein